MDTCHFFHLKCNILSTFIWKINQMYIEKFCSDGTLRYSQTWTILVSPFSKYDNRMKYDSFFDSAEMQFVFVLHKNLILTLGCFRQNWDQVRGVFDRCGMSEVKVVNVDMMGDTLHYWFWCGHPHFGHALLLFSCHRPLLPSPWALLPTADFVSLYLLC